MKKKDEKIIERLTQEWGKTKTTYSSSYLVQKYFAYRAENDVVFGINERAVNDLDFKDYFAFVDRTTSAIGQQYLYAELRALNQNADYLKNLESSIQHYSKDETLRYTVQKELTNLADDKDYYFPDLVYGQLPTKIKYIGLVKLLQVSILLCLFFIIYVPQFSLLLMGTLTLSMLIHYWYKNRIGNFVVAFGRLGQLAKFSRILLEYSNKTATEKEEKLSEIKKLDKLTSKVSFLKTNNLGNSELTDLLWLLIEIFKMFTLVEVVTFHELVKKIEEEQTTIESLYRFIGAIDMALSIASLRSGLSYYAVPNFTTDNKEFKVQQIYHPLVENCVANDLHLEEKSLLLTGSNMSGKSTFVKALNLNLITSQVLNTSFSKNYTAPFFSVATAIKMGDDINEQKSYFLDEVMTVGELIHHSKESQQQYLFTIDELFKGTNTIERVSAAKAILEFLNKSNHIILVSTHDIELTLLLKEGYKMHYFQESIENEILSFDYKLKQGALQKRNAINVLELMDYPSEIITEAKALAVRFEQEKTGNN